MPRICPVAMHPRLSCDIEGIPHFPDRSGMERELLPRDGYGIELGVMRGNHAERLLQHTRPQKLDLVDPWSTVPIQCQNVRKRFAEFPNVCVYQTTAEEYSIHLLPETVDWIVHDTSRSGILLETELELYDAALKVHGVIVIEYAGTTFAGGQVTRAVNTFLSKHPEYVTIGYVDAVHSLVLKKTHVPRLWNTRQELYEVFVPDEGKGLEIGVMRGDNAALLLSATRPSHLYLVDQWKAKVEVFPDGTVNRLVARWAFRYNGVCNRFKDQITAGLVSVIRSTSKDAASLFIDGTLDWIYLDADHHRRAVMEDLLAYTPKVTLGGLCMCHDWTYDISFGGVILSVYAFLQTHPEWEYVGATKESTVPTIVLRRSR